MKQKKNSRGGKRKGAGRKPLSYTTEMIRIPSPIASDVKKLKADYKAKHK